MAQNQESNWSGVQLTDRDVYALIRYLDPDLERGKQQPRPRSVNQQNDGANFVICASLLILLLGGLGLLLLYR